jgi:hypothetical protein
VKLFRKSGIVVPTVLVMAACLPVQAQTPFTIVALPDTQNYVNNANNAVLFTQQTQWIADEIQTAGNPRNIQFVTHLGDVVSSGSSSTQFDRADASMSVLDGVVEYGILPGNHDYASTGNKSSGTTLYVSYFGPTRFTGEPWYVAEPSGNNSYQTFTAGGYDFIHISMEWQPTVNVPFRVPSPIEWAQSVIDAHPDTPVILSTHEYVDDDPPGRSSAGEALWNELVRRNDQVFLVLCGHFHSAGGMNDGEYHQVSYNDAGRPVFEILQDYQDYPNGGNGWLRLIEFDVVNDQLKFETYSPVLDEFQTERVDEVGFFASEFELDIDFSTRLVPVVIEPPVSPFIEVVFQQGVDGYTGTEDKEIRSDGDDADNGDADEISVDGDDGSPDLQPTQGLIQFAEIIGDGPTQIPAGTVIEQASLILNVTNPGSGFEVYQMTVDWDESVQWVDLGGDGITPGVEATSTPVTAVGANNSSENVGTGPLSLDITSTMEAWLAGGDNFGVGLIPYVNGTNGIDFDSSESTAPPVLSVRRLAPGVSARTFQQGDNGYAGAVDTQIRQAAPFTEYSTATSVSIDASDPSGNENHGLFRFDGIFGSEAGQIPTTPGTHILLAELIVEGFNPGDGANVHRMLDTWVDTVTWSSGFAGDGIQADGIEAVEATDAVAVGGTGSVAVDVTASLRAWLADPGSNHGWALLPRGSNGWDFYTSEGTVAPQLKVYYGFTADCNDDGVVDLLDYAAFAACLAGPAGGLPEGCACFDFDGDEDSDIHDFAALQAYLTAP